MNIINKEEVIKHQNYPPLSSENYVYNAILEDDGKIKHQVSEGTKENSKYLQGGFIGEALGTVEHMKQDMLLVLYWL